MQAFKKKLCRLAGGSIMGEAVCLLLAAALALLGAVQYLRPAQYFDPFDKAGVQSELAVTYIMGPFAELAENDRTTEEYYIAEDEEGYWCLIAVNPNTTLPVYGVDVQDADIPTLPAVTVRGTSHAIDAEMLPYLMDFFNGELTEADCTEYFGETYLDTTNGARPGDAEACLFLFAGILALIAVLLLVPKLRSKAKLKAALAELEQTGELDRLYEEFSAGTPLYDATLKIAVSDHLILDALDTKNGLRVLRLADYCNAYRCNMLDGNPGTTYYIALETSAGSRTGTGFSKNRKAVENAVPKVRLGLCKKEEIAE